MTNDERNILQVMRYLDGQLSADDTAELNVTLRRDSALRDFLNAAAWQATTIADFKRSSSLRKTAERIEPSHRSVALVRRLHWLIAACLLLLAGLGFRTYLSHRSGGTQAQPTVLVTSISGPVNWTSTTVGNRTTPEVGVRLGNGILETEAESASVQIQFDDGTTLTLGGASELAFSDDGRKTVRLKRGSVAAQVARQPAGQPMTLQTPTATLEILGTIFSVTAQPEQTLLNVTEGRVRLRRLADGREVEVLDKQSTLASLDSGSDLTPTQRIAPPVGFCQTFAPDVGASNTVADAKGDRTGINGANGTEEPPPRNWHQTFVNSSDRFRGTWLPATDAGVPARLAAVPYVAGRRGNSITVHHGIVLRAQPGQNAGAMVTLQHDSVVRICFRTAHPGNLLAMLITRNADGSFGGNFEQPLAYGDTQSRPNGWRVLEVPLSSFRPLIATHPDPVGREVTKLLFSTVEKDLGLEVAEVTIAPFSQLKSP